MLNKENFKQYKSAELLFKKSRRIILTTHRNPDGDAIGSVLALYHLAKQLGKQAEVIIPDVVPSNYKFLEASSEIKVYDKERDYLSFISADLIIILDLNAPKRLFTMEDAITSARIPKILIDHHLEPSIYANEIISEPEACSTCEILYHFIKSVSSGELTKPIAEALYTGIMTDSGSFRFPRTTSEVHTIIAELIKFGADPVEIYDKIYNQNKIGVVHILGEALKSINLYHKGKLSIMTITAEMLENCGVTNADIENFAEKTLSVENAIAGVMISELESTRDEIRVSMRSKGDFSIREAAMELGGGGHLNAAGARIFNKSILEAKNEIIEVVGKYLAKTF